MNINDYEQSIHLSQFQRTGLGIMFLNFISKKLFIEYFKKNKTNNCVEKNEKIWKNPICNRTKTKIKDGNKISVRIYKTYLRPLKYKNPICRKRYVNDLVECKSMKNKYVKLTIIWPNKNVPLKKQRRIM